MPELESAKKRRDRQTAVTLVIVLAAALIIFTGGAILFSKLFAGGAATVDDYELYELESTTYSATIDADGTVTAYKTAVTLPDVDATVESVNVEEGDEVEEGDLLVTLSSSEIAEELSTASEELAEMQTAEDAVRVVYDEAEAALESAQEAKTLAQQALDEAAAAAAAAAEAEEQAAQDAEADETADGDADASADETADTSSGQTTTTTTLDASYDEAIAAAQERYDEAAAELEEAETMTAEAQSAYNAAASAAAALKVTASADGFITDLAVEEGMSVDDVEAEAAMNIADSSGFIVTCSIPAGEATSLEVDQEALVGGITASGGDVSATIVEIGEEPNGETSDEGGACYDVTLELAVQAEAAMDESVDVSIVVQDYGTVFYVPEGSVLEEDGAYYVQVVYEDDTTANHEVELVDSTQDGQLIIAGSALSDGVNIRADLT